MIGDVNLFLVEDDGDDDHDDDDQGAASSQSRGDGNVGKQPSRLVGEIEIMIARKHMQRRGYGRSTLLTFLWYVINHVPVSYTHLTLPTKRIV